MTLEAWDDEAAQAAGFYGRVIDPTPNANYTASMATPDARDGPRVAQASSQARIGPSWRADQARRTALCDVVVRRPLRSPGS